MLFFVNMLKKQKDDNLLKIGLFTNNAWTGTGNINGFLKTDFYRDTVMLAYGTQKMLEQDVLNMYTKFEDIVILDNREHKSVQIEDKKFERRFEADSIEEAIKIFREQRY